MSTDNVYDVELASTPDGSVVPIRPIRPEDEAAHRRFVARLSEMSKFSRFLHAVRDLSAADTDRFVHVDGVARVALVALDPAAPDEIIAIARYDRSADPSEAEIAIVVDDTWQGRGLGTLLIHRLIDHATKHGVKLMRANILAGNVRSLALFHELGLPEHARLRDGIVELDLILNAADGPISIGF